MLPRLMYSVSTNVYKYFPVFFNLLYASKYIRITSEIITNFKSLLQIYSMTNVKPIIEITTNKLEKLLKITGLLAYYSNIIASSHL